MAPNFGTAPHAFITSGCSHFDLALPAQHRIPRPRKSLRRQLSSLTTISTLCVSVHRLLKANWPPPAVVAYFLTVPKLFQPHSTMLYRMSAARAAFRAASASNSSAVARSALCGNVFKAQLTSAARPSARLPAGSSKLALAAHKPVTTALVRYASSKSQPVRNFPRALKKTNFD